MHPLETTVLPSRDCLTKTRFEGRVQGEFYGWVGQDMDAREVSQSFFIEPKELHEPDWLSKKTCLLNCLPSRITQAAMVDAGIADSSQSRFITSCLSKGANNLNVLSESQKVCSYWTRSTEILIDTMKAIDTGEWAYFGTVFLGMGVVHEEYSA